MAEQTFAVGQTIFNRYYGGKGTITEIRGEWHIVDFGYGNPIMLLAGDMLPFAEEAAPVVTSEPAAPAEAVSANSVKPTITAILRSGEVVPVIKYLGKGFVRVGGKYGGYSDVFITDFQMISDLMDAIIDERVRDALAESEDAAQ